MTFPEIHNKYFRPLCYFADKIIDNREQAKDISSEALVKLWQRFDGFKNEQAIKTFLYLIVRNACLDHIKHRNYLTKSKDGYDYISDKSEESILYLMMEAEILTEITNGIEKLPKAERKIFKLLFLQEMSIEKVSQKLGLSIKTIRNQKAIAIRHLKYSFFNK